MSKLNVFLIRAAAGLVGGFLLWRLISIHPLEKSGVNKPASKEKLSE